MLAEKLEKTELQILAVMIAKELASLLQKKQWLSLREAAQEYHIGERRLILLAKEGKIKGYQEKDTKRGDWIFYRDSLDEYRISHCPVLTAKEKALAIIKDFKI